MKFKIVTLIIIILSIIAVTSVFAQDCTMNGVAGAANTCPAGTAGDDIFIITGLVTSAVIPGDGNDTIIMIGSGSISPLPGGSGVFTTTTSGDITVIGGSIITVSVQGIGIFEKLDGTVISSATIITSGDGGRGIQEENDGDAVNNGSITTSGDVSAAGIAAIGLRETLDGDAINNGIIITLGLEADGIAEHGEGDAINNGIIITSGNDARGIEEIGTGNVINNGIIISLNGVGIYTVDGTESDIVINNGSVTGATAAIETGGGNDTVVNNGTANGDINLGDGDDTMIVRNEVNGTMDGGAGTDTLIFELTIIGTEHDLNTVAQQMADANPAGGTVIINGQRYTWTNFESLIELLSLIDVNPSPCANDGRINIFDCHAPVALYGYPLQIYGVHPDTGEGTFAFSITQAQIDAAGIPESGTILIAEGTHPDTGLPIALYRHADGAFQINAFFADMKPYVGIWYQYGGFTNLSGEQG